MYLNGTLDNGSTDIFALTTDAVDVKTDCVLNIMGTGSMVIANPNNIVQSSTNASAENGGINKLAVYGGTLDGSAVTGTSGPIMYASEACGGYTEVEIYGGTMIGGKVSFTSSACYGGAFNLWGAAKFTMSDGTIRGGQAEVRTKTTGTARGGNVRLGDGGVFTMTGGTIEGGKANALSSVPVYGGNVDLGANATFTMSGGTIQGGTASLTADDYVGGGNVHMGAGSTFTMTGGKILNGTVTATGDSSPGSSLKGYGGNVYITGGADNTVVATVSISNGEISGGSISSNYEARGGNVFAGDYTQTTISDNALIQNGSSESAGNTTAAGGNIATGSGSTFTMTGGKILNGTAYGKGKEVATDSITEDTNNSTCGYGGNVSINSSSTNNSTVIISGGEISGGKAYSFFNARGGNLYTTTGAQVTISGENTLISNGLSQGRHPKRGTSGYNMGGRGGNMYFVSGNVTITGGQIKNGTCAESAVDGTTGLNYTDSGCRGGNVYFGGGPVNITGGTFYNGNKTTQAWMGGNIYTAGSLTINGADVKIIGGNATRGGCIGTVGGTLTIQNGIIRGGYAVTTGGCLHTEATAVKMTGGEITKAATGDDLYYTRGTTSGTGGAVHVGGGTFTMDGANAVIDGLTAENGAAVYVGAGGLTTSKRGAFVLKNGTINGATAESNGGAIGVRDGCTVTISGGTVNSGKATKLGDCIMVETGGLLTVANGFTGKLDVCFEGAAADVIVDNKIVSTMAAADGYVAGGMVFAEVDGVKYPVVGKGTELVLADAVITNGDGEILAIPATAQAAVDTQLAAGQFVQLQRPGTSFAFNKVTVVDFNGKDASVTSGTGYLIGMDSATNDYTEDGAAKVAFSEIPTVNNEVELTVDKEGEPVTGTRKYLALANQDGTYSFHRYYLSMDKAGLRTSDNDGIKGPGIAFSAVFRGDEAVKNAITAYGVEFDVAGNKTAFAYSDAFVATERNEGKLLAVHGLMNETHQSTEVSAKAYIKVGEDTIYSTNAASNNLKALVETYAASYNSGDLATAFIAPYEAMIAKYGDAMRLLQWKIDKEVA